MATRVCILLSCLIFAMTIQIMFHVSDAHPPSHLEIGYYKYTCPEAESIVKSVVKSLVEPYPGLGAGVIRMFFHDCFVRGCDASILLDSSPSNPDPEKNAVPNVVLRGFEVIDAAKEALEKACPGVVSCADIIAFAARDATSILGKFSYDIPSGRYDGRISIKDEANNLLPPPTFNLDQLKDTFSSVGLSTEDLVALSGSHSIGRSHCSSFTNRLYPSIDPTMDFGFGVSLRMQCPEDAPAGSVVPQDFVTPDVLDGQYYGNVKALKSLFFSDWSLLTSPETKSLVDSYSTVPGLFEAAFGKSMVNMGNIGVHSKYDGEIRKSCSSLN